MLVEGDHRVVSLRSGSEVFKWAVITKGCRLWFDLLGVGVVRVRLVWFECGWCGLSADGVV